MSAALEQSAAQQRTARMAKQVQVANDDIFKTPELKGAAMLGVQYCDVGREKNTVLGNNLNDVRVMVSHFDKDPYGQEIPSTATPWTLAHVMANTTNYEDARASISTKLFNVVVADPDGTHKRHTTLDQMLGAQFRSTFRDEGLAAGCDMSTEKVAVAAPRFAFLEKPADEKKQGIKYCITSWSYNTINDANPKNVMFFCDTMNTSMHLETPGHEGTQHLYTKLLDADGVWKQYSGKLTSTDRTIENIGTESKEESRAAAARGEGTQVNTGPITWGGQSCAAFVIQCELKSNAPVAGAPMSSAIPIGVPLGGDDGEEHVRYTSLGSFDDDEDNEPVWRSGPQPKRSTATEGRVSIGPCQGRAPALAKTKLEAASQTCLATPMFFLTMDHGTVPTIESMTQALQHSKKCHALTIAVGKDLRDRHSDESEAEGLTAPMSKVSKSEFAHNTGVKMDTDADPTPVLTGIPA